ncbi:type VI secretion system amidase effector protein Tae4 [Acidovorax sp. GBBC 3334]|uniref:type VI secretion system amidase effector protein Tae4 n=1 Tax=Acidovorax sp. GBBC 3334 TaxID=2940496 RepID=UPI002302BED8|nr:type VI secretion system amidase effector protein Tae4 [Acidovorax sp. GBBC 3334]MDA8455946.1 type VI secretion system amidase effector protein Tae4 [Acidovorax sp. GBBC 3334]
MPKFIEIWNNHPTVRGEKPLLDRRAYENQCAVNFSAALIRSGVSFKSFHGAWSWQAGTQKYPIRAQQVADWLTSGASKLPIKTEKFSGKDAFGLNGSTGGMTGRSGLVFFQNYWGTGRQGDHIDLWNGNRLTDWFSWARIHVRIGDFGFHDIGAGSDYAKSASIWFWRLS